MNKQAEAKFLYITSLIVGVMANFNVVLLPFFYYAKGMNDGQVALLLSATYLSALFMPIFGYITDATIGPKKMLKKISVGIIIVSLCLLISNSFEMLFIFSVLFSLFRGLTYPLSDNLILAFCNENDFVYGALRKGSSYGFAFGVLFAMPIILVSNIIYVVVYPVILSVMLLIILNKIKFDINLSDNTSSLNDYKANIIQLFSSKRFLVLLSVNLFVLGISDLKLSYQSSLLDGFGASIIYIVILNISSTMFELLFMSKTEKFFRRHHISFLILIVVLLGVVQNIVLLTSSSLFVILIAASLHGLSMSIYIPNFFSYMSKVIPVKASSTGYIVNSTVQCLSTFIVNSIFIAPLVVANGIRVSFIVIAIIISLSLIPAFILFKIDDKKS